MSGMPQRPYAPVLERLKEAGLRPTRQRLALARILFSNGDRHVTAEQLHDEALKAEIPVSLATIYNTQNDDFYHIDAYLSLMIMLTMKLYLIG